MHAPPAGALVLAVTLMMGRSAVAGQAADGAEVQRGRALLSQYQCGACHAIPGVVSSRGTAAQPLERWSGRSYIAGRLPNRRDVLAQWIVAPQALLPGTTMPSMGVSPEDAQAMAAYLFSLD